MNAWEDRLDRLEAIERIRALKARYFRLIDTKRWDDLPALFTTDLQVLTPGGKVYADSGEAYAAALRNSLRHAVSCHQGFDGEIDLIDRDTATAIWPMQDTITWGDRHPATGWKAILGRGHYHETYRREGEAWKIATLTLTRLRLDIEWPEGHPPT